MTRLLAIGWAELRVVFLALPCRAFTAAYGRALDDLIALRERR